MKPYISSETYQSLLHLEVLSDAASPDVDPRSQRQCVGQYGVEVQRGGFLSWLGFELEFVSAAYHLLEGAETHLGHVLADFLCYQEQVVDHVLRLAYKLLTQHWVLGAQTYMYYLFFVKLSKQK